MRAVFFLVNKFYRSFILCVKCAAFNFSIMLSKAVFYINCYAGIKGAIGALYDINIPDFISRFLHFGQFSTINYAKNL